MINVKLHSKHHFLLATNDCYLQMRFNITTIMKFQELHALHYIFNSGTQFITINLSRLRHFSTFKSCNIGDMSLMNTSKKSAQLKVTEIEIWRPRWPCHWKCSTNVSTVREMLPRCTLSPIWGHYPI